MANIWNINFSNLNTSNDGGYYSATGKYTKLSNITDGVYTADGAGSTPALSINAVDIDWNGAVLPQSNISNGGSLTINNTGELLNLVNEIICIKCSPRVVS
jgi:hypothetical protein